MKRIPASLIIVLFLATSIEGASPAPTSQPSGRMWLVVTRKMFATALKALVDRRRAEGFQVAVSTLPPAKAIASQKRRPDFILLVGDDQPGKHAEAWRVPSPRRKLYRWRAAQKKEFAADVLLGDFDNDLTPEARVGRIPVRTDKQLRTIIKRIIAYESRGPSLEDLRLAVWGGAPGYNAMIDSLAANMAITSIRTNSPAWIRPWMIISDPNHSLCGDPLTQSTMFTEQLSGGGTMSVMMGHASLTGFFSMRSGKTGVWFTAEDARKGLTAGRAAPTMTIFSCNTGDFTRARQSLAESLLLTPGGPTGVIAATTESHPLTNYFSGLCLLKSLGRGHKRLGDLWFEAQNNASLARNAFVERMLRNVEGKLEDEINVAKLRRDQILMYALLGDPAMRIHLPQRLGGKIERVGDKWKWSVIRPKDATVLHVGFRKADMKIPVIKTPEDRRNADKLFDRANGQFGFKALCRLGRDADWSGTLTGSGVLRLVAIGPKNIYAAGINLRPPKPARSPSGSAKR